MSIKLEFHRSKFYLVNTEVGVQFDTGLQWHTRDEVQEFLDERKLDLNENNIVIHRKTTPAERSREWREENPETAIEHNKRGWKTRKERYHADPEFRAKYLEYQREWRRRKHSLE